MDDKLKKILGIIGVVIFVYIIIKYIVPKVFSLLIYVVIAFVVLVLLGFFVNKAKK